MKEAKTFSDVQIVPKYSEIESRDDVDLTAQFTMNYKIKIPLVAAPMDTVCDYNMAKALLEAGGVGVLHRWGSIEEEVLMVSKLRELAYAKEWSGSPIAAAIGVNGDSKERALRLLIAGANVLVIDVAHGHHKNVKEMIYYLMELRKSGRVFDIVAGSIATYEAAQDLEEWGADALRVGVGAGSICETRIRTGIGIPQLESVLEAASVATIPIISDGGIRYPGDAAKALAAGADTVMIGSLFAGTDESPGEVFIGGVWPDNYPMKVYRGLASATTKLKYSGAATHVEGASKMIESRGPVQKIISDITDGIKSSMSYVGAKNLEEFRDNATFVRITSAGLTEAFPHLLGDR